MKLVVSRWSDNELSTAAVTIYTITGANERYTSLLNKIRCTSIVIFFFRSVKISIYSMIHIFVYLCNNSASTNEKKAE